MSAIPEDKAERPVRLITPAGGSFIQHAVAPRRRAA